MFKLRRSLACILACSLFYSVLSHADGQSFDEWVQDFSRDAQAQGISAATLQAALADAQPIDRVVELDQAQPEFAQTFLGYLGYLGRRVTPKQIARGQR